MSILLRSLRATQYVARKSFMVKNQCCCHIRYMLKVSSPTVNSPELNSIRLYAKGRDKVKEKGKKKILINESQLEEVINVSNMREKMESAVEGLKEDFIKHLSLRSSFGSIENLKIVYEGEDYILQDLAQITRKNPKTLIINMSSFPQVTLTVMKALAESGMNVNPQQEGTTIIIPVPKVTKEHRENLIKNSKALFIKSKDNIKDIQNKFIKNVKNKEKTENLATDDIHSISDQITQIANQYIDQAEKILNEKQQELKGDSK